MPDQGCADEGATRPARDMVRTSDKATILE